MYIHVDNMEHVNYIVILLCNIDVNANKDILDNSVINL